MKLLFDIHDRTEVTHPVYPPRCVSEVPQLTQDNSVLASVPAPIQAPVAVHPPLNEAVVVDEFPSNNSISSVTPSEPPGFESVSLPVSVPTSVALPALTFVNGCRTAKPCPMLENSQDFDGDIMDDDLDDLLDQVRDESGLVSDRGRQGAAH